MNGKKIVVTGASGMLGSNIISNFDKDTVIGLDGEFDITNSKMVMDKLNEIQPKIIIHTAAFTDVEACEKDIDRAYKINSIGTQNLVNYCINKDILFIYISSTGIYGPNQKNAYIEFDDVSPTTIHHKSKYAGEVIVTNHLNKYLILRTGWLFGGKTTHQKNFVYKRYLEAKNASIIYSDNTQIGNPTYIVDLVNQIKLLIENDQYGTYNCVNEAISISRYDYVKKIIELFELPCNVAIAPTGMFTRIAPVSHNESAINFKLNLLGLNRMGNWEKSLQTYINEIKKEL